MTALVAGDAGTVNITFLWAAWNAGVLRARPRKRRNQKLSGIRRPVEHIFRMMKRQVGSSKTR